MNIVIALNTLASKILFGNLIGENVIVSDLGSGVKNVTMWR